MRLVIYVILGLAAAVVLAIAIPVYMQMSVRDKAQQGWTIAMQVAERLHGKAPGALSHGNGASLLPGGQGEMPAQVERIQVLNDGAVRVTFNAPAELRGKALEVRASANAIDCHAIGIEDKYLPGPCRSGH